MAATTKVFKSGGLLSLLTALAALLGSPAVLDYFTANASIWVMAIAAAIGAFSKSLQQHTVEVAREIRMERINSITIDGKK